MEPILLRPVEEHDLPIFFAHQRDPDAIRMAAFSSRDEAAFMAHWRSNILGDETVIARTILCRDRVAGNIVCFERSGRRLIGYWLGRDFWGRGVATEALGRFLAMVDARPLDAYVAKTNVGSIRVLEKCGFTRTSETDGGDGGVAEFVYSLAD